MQQDIDDMKRRGFLSGQIVLQVIGRERKGAV